MTKPDFEFAYLDDPRFAAHALNPVPVWLWSADADRILWTNPTGASIFDAASPGAIATLQRVRRRFPFHTDDLRYKHVEVDTKEESNAAVICIMDTSGSMDTMKKYLARSFFFLLYQFISTRYRNVEIVFIAHHTEASEVTEEDDIQIWDTHESPQASVKSNPIENGQFHHNRQ